MPRSSAGNRSGEVGEAHAVIIGIDVYRDESITPLRFARADAVGMHKLLTDPELGGIPEANTTLLINEDATRTALVRALGVDLQRRVGPNDRVLVYFAGHGAIWQDERWADGFEKFLLPHDADAELVPVNAISMEMLQRELGRCSPKQLVIFLDACYSGGAASSRGLTESSELGRASLVDEHLDRLSGEGRVVVTACGARQVALEDRKLGHGVFTYFLLKGLEGEADRDRGTGVVTLDALYEFVFGRVEAHARTLRGKMEPRRKGAVQGSLVLTRYETKNEPIPPMGSKSAATALIESTLPQQPALAEPAGLVVTLTPDPPSTTVPAKVTWVVTVTNNGPGRMTSVRATFGKRPLAEAFDLEAGASLRFAPESRFKASGTRQRSVTVFGNSPDGGRVRRTASATVELLPGAVTEDPKPPTGEEPSTSFAEMIQNASSGSDAPGPPRPPPTNLRGLLLAGGVVVGAAAVFGLWPSSIVSVRVTPEELTMDPYESATVWLHPSLSSDWRRLPQAANREPLWTIADTQTATATPSSGFSSRQTVHAQQPGETSIAGWLDGHQDRTTITVLPYDIPEWRAMVTRIRAVTADPVSGQSRGTPFRSGDSISAVWSFAHDSRPGDPAVSASCSVGRTNGSLLGSLGGQWTFEPPGPTATQPIHNASRGRHFGRETPVGALFLSGTYTLVCAINGERVGSTNFVVESG